MALVDVAVKAIDTWLGYQIQFADLPGFQASIRKAGDLVFSKAYGYAALETKDRYTTKHVGRIASHSKMFTSCLTLALHAQGVLALDDLVITHLPQYKKHKDKRFKTITVRDLLSNRSGLFRDGRDSPFWELEGPFLSEDKLEDEILSTRLIYNPNEHTKYSNLAFSLLGSVLAAAGHAHYSELVRRHVLDKLPKHALSPEYSQSTSGPYAHGYTRKIYAGERKAFRQTTTGAMAPATGFCGTMDSTTLFVHALHNTDMLIPEPLRREIMNLKWPVKNLTEDFYGLGTMFNQVEGVVLAGHSGGYPGFTSRTQSQVGSEYVFGTIANCNESYGHAPLLSMAKIIDKIQTLFTESEAQSLIVSSPMINCWSTSIYVLGKNKALVLPLGNWSPCAGSMTLMRRKDGCFYSDDLAGYSSVGEPVRFNLKNHQIETVQFASYTGYRMADYVKRGTEQFV